jgi:predicted nucleotide-binding protein
MTRPKPTEPMEDYVNNAESSPDVTKLHLVKPKTASHAADHAVAGDDSIDPDRQVFSEPGLWQINDESWQHRTKASNVFVVHGHDLAAEVSVASFLKDVRLNPVVLEEQPNIGSLTIIEKLMFYATDVSYTVVLLTADENGWPRPNVLIELGLFIGRYGRGRISLLKGDDVKMPSDLAGVLYIELDAKGAWKGTLAKEMSRAGLPVDCA